MSKPGRKPSSYLIEGNTFVLDGEGRMNSGHILKMTVTISPLSLENEKSIFFPLAFTQKLKAGRG